MKVMLGLRVTTAWGNIKGGHVRMVEKLCSWWYLEYIPVIYGSKSTCPKQNEALAADFSLSFPGTAFQYYDWVILKMV